MRSNNLPTFTEELGLIIRLARERKLISAYRLAKNIKCSKQTINKVEKGLCSSNIVLVLSILDELSIDPCFIIRKFKEINEMNRLL